MSSYRAPLTATERRAIDVVRKKGETSIEEEPTAMEVAADSPDPLARREMTEELKRLLECVGRLEPDRRDAPRLQCRDADPG